MTNEQREIFELYGKLGKTPSIRSLVLDFGITKDKAKELFNEWALVEDSELARVIQTIPRKINEQKKVVTQAEPPKEQKKVVPQVEPPKEQKIEILKREDLSASHEKSMLQGMHSVHETIPAVRWSIKIIALLISIACLFRGFIIIQQYNGDQWFSYLMPIIMQGISLIFPVISFTEMRKKKPTLILGAIFFFLFSAISISYEIQVSLDSFSSISIQNQQKSDSQKAKLDLISLGMR